MGAKTDSTETRALAGQLAADRIRSFRQVRFGIVARHVASDQIADDLRPGGMHSFISLAMMMIGKPRARLDQLRSNGQAPAVVKYQNQIYPGERIEVPLEFAQGEMDTVRPHQQFRMTRYRNNAAYRFGLGSPLYQFGLTDRYLAESLTLDSS